MHEILNMKAENQKVEWEVFVITAIQIGCTQYLKRYFQMDGEMWGGGGGGGGGRRFPTKFKF